MIYEQLDVGITITHSFFFFFFSETATETEKTRRKRRDGGGDSGWYINRLSQTLQLLFYLRLDDGAHTLPARSGRHGGRPALLLLKTHELLRQHLVEIVPVLAAQRKFDRISELGRVGGGEGDVAGARVPLDRAERGSDSDGGVRVEDISAGLGAVAASGAQVGREAGGVDGADGVDGLVVADALALEFGLGALQDGAGHAEAALGLELAEPRADALAGVPAPLLDRAGAVSLEGQEPEETLEVAADQDVHCGAEGLLDAVRLRRFPVDWLLGVVAAAAEEAVENVILIRGDDKLFRWQTHALGEPARQDVTEVARWDDEADLRALHVARGLRQGEVRVEVVCHLGQDTCPVDRVHSREVVGGVEVLVGEQRLDDVLAVVERSLNGKVVHVRVQHGRHLSLLDGRDSPLREQDEDRDIFLASQSVDGGRASISAGGANDGEVVPVLANLALIFPSKEVFEEVS